MIGAPAPWEQIIRDDRALACGFPKSVLGPLLDQADVKITLQVESPFSHPALGPSTGMDCYRVIVSWKDRDERRKEVTLARLIDRQ